MKKNDPNRLFAAMLGVAFSTSLLANAGAVDMTPPFPAALVSSAAALNQDADTSEPNTAPSPEEQPTAPTALEQQDPSPAPGGPGSPEVSPQYPDAAPDDQDADLNVPSLPVEKGDFIVQKLAGDKLGEDFIFENDCLTFLHGGEYVVSMKNPGVITQNQIAVAEHFIGSITIDGLRITADPNENLEDGHEKPAIKVDGSAVLTLCLKGQNVLTGGADAAAIQFQNVVDRGHLTIKAAEDDAKGSLLAFGGKAVHFSSQGNSGGSGIGGRYDRSTRNITIESGMITAVATGGCAGIGGGEGKAGDDIEIKGGKVTATGGELGGAGIGGGNAEAGQNIVISGGIVNAQGFSGAGIGSGGQTGPMEYSTIKMIGGSVTARSEKGDAIGAGLLNAASGKTEITIGNASVNAPTLSVAPKNEMGKTVYLLHLTDFKNFDTVFVDGKPLKDTIPTPEKQELSLYLAEGQKISYDGKSFLTNLSEQSQLLLVEEEAAQPDPDPNSGSTPAPQQPDNGSTPAPQQPDNGGTPAPQQPDNGSTPAPQQPDNGGKPAPQQPDNGRKPAPQQPNSGSKPNPGSGGSHSGGGSSSTPAPKPQILRNADGSTTETVKKSDGTTVETTKRADGSQSIVETRTDKTVIKTDWDKQGNMMEITAKPDGSSITTEVRKDGTRVTTSADQKGNISAEVNPAKDKKVTVTIPTQKQPAPGDVIVIVSADGTEKVVPKTAIGANGLSFSAGEPMTIRVVDRSKAFIDVPNQHWAARAVDFVTSRSLFQGINETEFAPDSGMTRGMLAVALHNLESNPAAAFSGSFTDVAENAWYKGAVQWAVQKDIVRGYGNGLFGADDQITREQLAVMLYRYSGSPSVSAQALDFTDADQISSFADHAVRWAVEKNILNGIGNGSLDPKGTATRAQVAVMLTRLVETGTENEQ